MIAELDRTGGDVPLAADEGIDDGLLMLIRTTEDAGELALLRGKEMLVPLGVFTDAGYEGGTDTLATGGSVYSG